MDGWREFLGCPCCRGVLHSVGGDALHCPRCRHSFPILDGIPRLLRREDAATLTVFSQQYRQDRLRDGWRPMTPGQALALPFGRPPGYPALYWEVRRQSYGRLMRLLTDEGPAPEVGTVADLGAGTGWLSYRLAQAAYRVLAVEASLDDAFGLGAARVYFSQAGFLPVQGDLEHPPLHEGRLSLAIFNASLHYARDLAGTLRRVAEALQPAGRLILLDTPIAQGPRPGTGRGDRHLGHQELQQALLGVGLRPRWISVRRGLRWWIHQARALLKGDVRFSLPMVVADRL